MGTGMGSYHGERRKDRRSEMATLTERYVVDHQGNPVSVLLDIHEYHALLAELEELESVRAYDAATGSQDEVIASSRRYARSRKHVRELSSPDPEASSTETLPGTAR